MNCEVNSNMSICTSVEWSMIMQALVIVLMPRTVIQDMNSSVWRSFSTALVAWRSWQSLVKRFGTLGWWVMNSPEFDSKSEVDDSGWDTVRIGPQCKLVCTVKLETHLNLYVRTHSSDLGFGWGLSQHVDKPEFLPQFNFWCFQVQGWYTGQFDMCVGV